MPNILFAIDDGHELYARARFLRHLADLRNLKKAEGDIRTAIGCWLDPEGRIHFEHSYWMSAIDYIRHVVPHGWVNNQQCVLAVSSGGCWLAETLEPALVTERLPGSFTCTGRWMPEGDWTRFDDTGEFWQVKP